MGQCTGNRNSCLHSYTVAIYSCNNIKQPYGTPQGFPTSPLQLSLKLYLVNSIKLLVLDSARSYDTARVGLPTAYIYRYVVVQQLYVPLGRQLSVTPASMGLFPIAIT